MPDLFLHVRNINDPNVELDPCEYFAIAETEEGDFIVPHDPSEIHSFQWGKSESTDGMNLFVFIEKKVFSQMIPYPKREDDPEFAEED